MDRHLRQVIRPHQHHHNTTQQHTTPHTTTQHHTPPHNTTHHHTPPHTTTQHHTTPHNTTQHNTAPHNHHHQGFGPRGSHTSGELQRLCCNFENSSGTRMAGSVVRRRQRMLRSVWRHEQMAIKLPWLKSSTTPRTILSCRRRRRRWSSTTLYGDRRLPGQLGASHLYLRSLAARC